MDRPSGLARGATYLLRGFGLWRTRPGLMLLGMVPALIVLLLVGGSLIALALTVGDLVAWATPFADDWGTGATVLRSGLAVLTVVAALLLASATFTALTLAIGDPFYERIWKETERMLGGEAPDRGPGFWRSVRDGLVLTAYGVLTAVLLVVIGLLPVVGAVAGVVLGFAVAGRALAGELVGRPLEARGLDRAARRDLLRAHRPAVLGFGLATQACFLIPLGAVAVMPAAVAGSTMLAREALGGPVAPAHRQPARGAGGPVRAAARRSPPTKTG